MRISITPIGLILLLGMFAFTSINCAGKVQKTIDPNAPRELKDFKAQGESSTRKTDDDPGKITVEAKCTEDYPILFQCKNWWAETGTAGDNPFKLTGQDGAIQHKTANSCVCEGRHGELSKDFFGVSSHYIKCGVTAVCANK